MNLATAVEFQLGYISEIARLHAEIERLRLTDAEREAIEWAARMVDSVNRGDPGRAATLRGLLDRTETVAK
jgi:hypothetical protein